MVGTILALIYYICASTLLHYILLCSPWLFLHTSDAMTSKPTACTPIAVSEQTLEAYCFAIICSRHTKVSQLVMSIFKSDRTLHIIHGTSVLYRHGLWVISISIFKVCCPDYFKVLLQQDITCVLSINMYWFWCTWCLKRSMYRPS